MRDRPSLLFLCHTLPYPLDGGVWIRSYHVLRVLAGAFDVTALFFERIGVSGRRARLATEEALEALGRFGPVEAFPIPQSGSPLRFVADHVRSVVTRRVYTRYLYESGPYRARVRELAHSGRFDLVHVDSLDLSAYLSECVDLPTACTHHNVESALLRRRAEFEAGPLAGRYFAFQAGLMEREERRWAGRVALNVMVSEEDRAQLTEIAPGASAIVVPNGVDVEEFAPSDVDGERLAYIGGTNWFPNLDALQYFCTDILPAVRAAGVDVPVEWVGSASDEEQRRFREQYGVTLTGYVDDVRPSMREAFCHIVPLRSGGGTRLKILNSWAMGKPVVSTSVGCEGLAAVDGENILIRDEPASFAEAIVALRGDATLRGRLGRAARRTAVEKYSWGEIGRGLIAAYERLLPGRSA